MLFFYKIQALYMFYNIKKFEVSISSDSNETMNRTIEFFLKTLYKSMMRRGIIPRRVNKKSAKGDSPGYSTALSQSPGVCDPGESLMTTGSQQSFLYTLAEAFKGTVAQK